MTRFVALLLVTGLACGNQSSNSTPPVDKPVPAEPAEEHKAIIKMVADAMESGFGAHDLETYLSIWTEDAQLIHGRSASAEPTDRRLTHEQNKAGKALRFAGPPPSMNQEVQNATVETLGDDRLLSWTLVEATGDFRETVGETYKLRKVGDDWRVYENRWWLVEVSQADGSTTRFTPEHWAKKDAAVMAARQQDDHKELANALASAGLMGELHDEIRKWTETSPADPDLWWKRAEAAFRAGDGLDATLAACQASTLAPTLEKPAWAKRLTCPTK